MSREEDDGGEGWTMALEKVLLRVISFDRPL
jgi:hypothetical protein